MIIKFVLPWPTKGLSPNARTHWAQLAKEKKDYRFACAMTAKQQGGKKIEAEKLHLKITFHPPSKRHYDIDNLLASIKSGLDGLADVLGVDDKHWSLEIHRSDQVMGQVVIEVVNSEVEK